jgi:hypothetical protein
MPPRSKSIQEQFQPIKTALVESGESASVEVSKPVQQPDLPTPQPSPDRLLSRVAVPVDSRPFKSQHDAQKCPYCSSANDCAHLLLLVDRTFRSAEGGALMRAFNDRWTHLCENGGDDFDECEPFDSLLDEVDAYADSSAEYDHEGGPGMSSSYSIYYVESTGKADAAVTRFVSGGEE